MQQPSTSVPEPTIKLKSKFLLACSIINILIFPLCVALEVAKPVTGVGVWGSFTFIVTGLLSFSTSYTPTKSLLIATLFFSSISIILAIVSCIFASLGQVFGYTECLNVWNGTTFQYDRVCVHTYPYTQMVLAVVCVVALVNNLIVTVLCSKTICKCCKKSVDSTTAVVINPQQQTSIWNIPPGQQQQFQSYPAVVIFSPNQQQSMQLSMHQQGQRQQQSTSAFYTNSNDELTNSAPPSYSIATESEPHQIKYEN